MGNEKEETHDALTSMFRASIISDYSSSSNSSIGHDGSTLNFTEDNQTNENEKTTIDNLKGSCEALTNLFRVSIVSQCSHLSLNSSIQNDSSVDLTRYNMNQMNRDYTTSTSPLKELVNDY